MHPVGDLGGQRIVDQPVHLQTAPALERRRRDPDAKVTFATRAMAGMPLVAVGLVHHL